MVLGSGQRPEAPKGNLTPKGHLVPTGSALIVRREDAASMSPGGILIPDKAKAKPTVGVVVAVGPGTFYPQLDRVVPIDFAVGDRVIFGEFAGMDFKHDGQDFTFLHQEQVFAKIALSPDYHKTPKG